MVDFGMPPVSNNELGWGPPPSAELAPGICDFVEHLDKFPVGRIGRICDITASGQRFQQERSMKGKGKGKFPMKGLAPAQPGRDDEGFALVDNKSVADKSMGKGRGGLGGGRGKGKGKAIAANYQEGILGQKQKQVGGQFQSKGKGKKGKSRGKGREPSFKEWSIKVENDWIMKQEIRLASLSQLRIDATQVKVEDLFWCGRLHEYNKDFDRITVKTEKKLDRFEALNFFNVSTQEDPHLMEVLQSDPEVTVIATDQILACLVAASRSIYSWDIVVTKIQGKVIFDKRDNTIIDLLTVNETAADSQLSNDEVEHPNAPGRLFTESACINQNFSQMAIDLDKDAEEMQHPNPFEGEEEPAASGAYRYRKFVLPGNPKATSEFEQEKVSLVVRTEVNCKIPGTKDQYALLKALNEYHPVGDLQKHIVPTAWRTRLEPQRGACFATELKNNSFKLGRWTVQAILAGCQTIKFGYVSRTSPADPWNHSVLGIQSYPVDTFADTIELKRNNIFGILRSIVDIVMGWEDGKYLIIKDPTKSDMRIYGVPWDFNDEEDEDEDDEGDQEFNEADEDDVPQPAR